MGWRRVRWAGVAITGAGVVAGLLLELPWLTFALPGSGLLPVASIVHRLIFWCVVPAGLVLIAVALAAPRWVAGGGTAPGAQVLTGMRPARRLALAGAVTCVIAVVAGWALERWAFAGTAVSFDVVGTPGFIAYRAVASVLSNVVAPGAAMLTALALAPVLRVREPAAERS